MASLDAQFPGLSQSTALLSCEESINGGVSKYVSEGDGPHLFDYISAEKEHVMVGIKINLDGRKGIMIADPGYHVGRVVTIMFDGKPPHTGEFLQHKSKSTLKQFNYYYNPCNSNYFEWHERAVKQEKEKYQISLVFAERHYLTAVSVTEKRNLIYSFKSQLRRDVKGNVIAGFYFPLNPNFKLATFTVFIGINAKAKYFFRDFINPDEIPHELLQKLKLVSKFMQCPTAQLVNTVCNLARVMSDEQFIRDVIALNNTVRRSCEHRQSAITGRIFHTCSLADKYGGGVANTSTQSSSNSNAQDQNVDAPTDLSSQATEQSLPPGSSKNTSCDNNHASSDDPWNQAHDEVLSKDFCFREIDLESCTSDDDTDVQTDSCLEDNLFMPAIHALLQKDNDSPSNPLSSSDDESNFLANRARDRAKRKRKSKNASKSRQATRAYVLSSSSISSDIKSEDELDIPPTAVLTANEGEKA